MDESELSKSRTCTLQTGIVDYQTNIVQLVTEESLENSEIEIKGELTSVENAEIITMDTSEINDRTPKIEIQNIIIKKPNRKRTVLPLSQRLELIGRLNNGEKFQELAQEYNIGRATIKDIYKKRHEYLKYVKNSDSMNAVLSRKTLVRSKMNDLDQEVYKWYKEQRSQGIAVTGHMLVETALRLHKEMGIKEPFNGSNGWSDRFRKRHGIRPHKQQDLDDTDPYMEHILLQAEQEKDLLKPSQKQSKNNKNDKDNYETPDFYLEQNTLVDATVEEQSFVEEKPSCSSTTFTVVEENQETKDVKQLQEFATYLVNEMKNLKSQKLIRNLKMDIMKLVYQAQDEDDKSA